MKRCNLVIMKKTIFSGNSPDSWDLTNCSGIFSDDKKDFSETTEILHVNNLLLIPILFLSRLFDDEYIIFLTVYYSVVFFIGIFSICICYEYNTESVEQIWCFWTAHKLKNCYKTHYLIVVF